MCQKRLPKGNVKWLVIHQSDTIDVKGLQRGQTTESRH